jgi:hypothetical protein
MSLRVRAAFVVRNIHVVYTLINLPSVIHDMQSFNKNYQIKVHISLSNFFNKIIRILFPSTKFLKFTPIGVNFPSSAHLRGIQNFHNLLSQSQPVNVLQRLPSNAFKYPYFTKHRIAITPIAKKPFSTALYKFLRMTLNM